MDSPQISTTSFIPKARLTTVPYKSRGLGMGFLLALFILLISLGLLAGTYLYKNSLQKQVDDSKTSLTEAKKAFEPKLIAELDHLNGLISAAKIVLGQHKVASNLFEVIADLTLNEVIFHNFNYHNEEKPTVSMSGEASSYTTVALQAKIFEQSESVESASFSNLSLKEGGKINFEAEIKFKPSVLIYKP